MKASKFTDAQKAFILKQAEEGLPVGWPAFVGGSGMSQDDQTMRAIFAAKATTTLFDACVGAARRPSVQVRPWSGRDANDGSRAVDEVLSRTWWSFGVGVVSGH